MKTILNHSDRAYDFPQFGAQKDGKALSESIRHSMIRIERSRLVNGEKVPGRVNVEDDQLKAMKAHWVCKHWFKDGQLSTAEEIDPNAIKAPARPLLAAAPSEADKK
jgi:hypothetical protein